MRILCKSLSHVAFVHQTDTNAREDGENAAFSQCRNIFGIEEGTDFIMQCQAHGVRSVRSFRARSRSFRDFAAAKQRVMLLGGRTSACAMVMYGRSSRLVGHKRE